MGGYADKREDMKGRTLEEFPSSVAQARTVHCWEVAMNAPFIGLGMNRQTEADALDRVKNRLWHNGNDKLNLSEQCSALTTST